LDERVGKRSHRDDARWEEGSFGSGMKDKGFEQSRTCPTRRGNHQKRAKVDGVSHVLGEEILDRKGEQRSIPTKKNPLNFALAGRQTKVELHRLGGMRAGRHGGSRLWLHEGASIRNTVGRYRPFLSIEM